MDETAQTLMMQSRWLLIGLMLLGIVGLSLLLLRPTTQTPETEKLTALTETTLTSFSVATYQPGRAKLEKTLQLQQRQQRWFVTYPIDIEAHPIQVKKLISVIYQTSHRHFDLKPGQLAQYGLDKPKMQLHINQDELLVGANDPIRKRRYVLYRGQIHLIDDTPGLWMSKAPEEFVSPSLLPDNSHITSVQLDKYQLQRKGSGWQLSPDIPGLSQDVLTELIDEWRFGQALAVKLLPDAATNTNTNSINIILRGRNTPIVFWPDAANNTLLRTDVGVQYELAPDTFLQLTQPRFETKTPLKPTVF